jgi:hypothetical protein
MARTPRTPAADARPIIGRLSRISFFTSWCIPNSSVSIPLTVRWTVRRSPSVRTASRWRIGADRESGHPKTQAVRTRPWFFCPLIVTNAELYLCRFDPADVDLRTGNLNAGVSAFEAVPYIRFRKGLSTDFPPVRDEIDLTGLSTERERTAFVVGAEALPVSDDPLPWKGTNT